MEPSLSVVGETGPAFAKLPPLGGVGIRSRGFRGGFGEMLPVVTIDLIEDTSRFVNEPFRFPRLSFRPPLDADAGGPFPFHFPLDEEGSAASLSSLEPPSADVWLRTARGCIMLPLPLNESAV